MHGWKKVTPTTMPKGDGWLVIRDADGSEWETDAMSLRYMVEEGDPEDFDGAKWRYKREDEE
jgi:hypothetical protein